MSRRISRINPKKLPTFIQNRSISLKRPVRIIMIVDRSALSISTTALRRNPPTMTRRFAMPASIDTIVFMMPVSKDSIAVMMPEIMERIRVMTPLIPLTMLPMIPEMINPMFLKMVPTILRRIDAIRP